MAINPEQVRTALAIIQYENWTSSGSTEHCPRRLGHVEPWRGWASDNRLEPSWHQIPQGERTGPQPFQVEERAVGNGTDKVEIKWTVWDDSTKLTNMEVELYSVMRAENRFIGEGYNKVASKYVQTLYRGGAPLNVENCGVDNFFLNRKAGTCIFCESKFTRDPATLASWMADQRRVWQLLRSYKADGKPCRQMSWEWIYDRARKALRRPANLEGAGVDEAASVIEENVRMLTAARDRRGKRFVNIFGAAQVPVYPGIYLFVAGEGGTPSVNELSVEWPITENPLEFIELGQAYDDWLKSRPSHASAPPNSPIVQP